MSVSSKSCSTDNGCNIYKSVKSWKLKDRAMKDL